jgi:hypothetical protein
MPGIIDADTHIAESESMWKYFDPRMYQRRPVMVSAPEDTLYRDFNVLWLIDGNIFPKPRAKADFGLSRRRHRSAKREELISVWAAARLPTSLPVSPTWTKPASKLK